MKKMIVASSSKVYGSEFLEYLLPTLSSFFKNIDTITFVPYARPSGLTYDQYTQKATDAFAKIDKKVVGVHQFDHPKKAIQNAEAIFTGGGNTFELLNQLYKHDMVSDLKQVIENGTPYLGTSAGSNICGINIKTTNDMPVVYPASFDALGLLPFNINPHYVNLLEGDTHMGETRETRIQEFHIYNDIPVLGLREGSWLAVNGEKTVLKGGLTAYWFQKNEETKEVDNEYCFELDA